MSTVMTPAAAARRELAAFNGRLVGPEDSGYDEARKVYNAMIDRRPAVIGKPTSPTEVAQLIHFAREHGLPVAVRGGGHNGAGLGTVDDGVVIDLSLMRDVEVRPQERTVRVGGGATWGEVDRATGAHGLATPSGIISTTGVGGLTLGGGIGYLARGLGLSCDNLVSADVVTADGKFVIASEKENEDLFWALRGGGGNFGVVTRFEHRLHPVGPEIYAGALAWRGEDASEVLEMYRTFSAAAPPELAVIAGMRPAPPAPWLPKDVHGKLIVAMFVCHTGDPAAGEKAVAPLRAFGRRPVGDIVQRRTYVSQQSLIDATQPKGRRYYWKSEYLPSVTKPLLGTVVEHAARIRSPHSAILMFPLGGALERLPEDHSAVGNRQTGAVLNIAGSWEKPEEDAEHVEWARAAWRDARKFSTGRVYVNFLTEDEGDDRVHQAYGSNYARLAHLKASWDPNNLFRVNKNIAPGPGASAGARVAAAVQVAPPPA